METTRYTISSDPVDYGENCTDGAACAREVWLRLSTYAAANRLIIAFKVVPETVSLGNRSTGDRDIIAELDQVREENWAGWMPQSAYRS